MAVNREVAWLVTYDIRNPRRLGRLHRFLVKRAVPIQYSVFALRASPAVVGQLVPEIEALIEPAEDDVRIYRIPEPAAVTTLGRGLLPEGVLLVDPATDWFTGAVHARPGGVVQADGKP